MTTQTSPAMGSGAGVEIDGLVVEYHRGGYPIRPLDGFSATVAPGRLAILLGPSGCGKTTLLSCLSAIQSPTAGSIRVGGNDVTMMSPSALTQYRRSTVGVVFQAFNLVPSLTALENVMVPMRSAGLKGSDAKQKAAALLADVGLGDRADHRPGSLSGGQMQRVAIARALALDPPLVVADEPTANLDHVQVEAVLRILRRLTDRGCTVIVSTHDQRLLPLADDVIDMSVGGHSDLTPMVTLQMQPGDVLFREGDRGDRIYVIDDGEVEILRDGVRAGTITPGNAFGEMAPTFNIRRTATAIARTPASLRGYTVAAFTAEHGGDALRRLVGRWHESETSATE